MSRYNLDITLRSGQIVTLYDVEQVFVESAMSAAEYGHPFRYESDDILFRTGCSIEAAYARKVLGE